MKINGFMLLISLVISGLIFFGFYSWDGDLLVSLGSALVGFLMFTAATAIGYSESARGAIMLKVMSGIFFVLMLMVNILFANFDASSTAYVITNGTAVCLWAAIFYGVARARQ